MASDCPNDTTQQDSLDKLQEHVKRLPVYCACQGVKGASKDGPLNFGADKI